MPLRAIAWVRSTAGMAATRTLWEGRYKPGLVDSGRYYLACSRYIELNPARAWMVAQPNEYPWSNYGANAEDRTDSLLTPHPE